MRPNRELPRRDKLKEAIQVIKKTRDTVLYEARKLPVTSSPDSGKARRRRTARKPPKTPPVVNRFLKESENLFIVMLVDLFKAHFPKPPRKRDRDIFLCVAKLLMARSEPLNERKAQLLLKAKPPRELERKAEAIRRRYDRTKDFWYPLDPAFTRVFLAPQ
jgi:hypothetical protein